MKRKILTLMLGLLTVTLAYAYDFKVVNDDGKTIYLNKLTDTTAEVTYSGSYYYSVSNEYEGEIVIPSQVTVEEGTYAGTYTIVQIYSNAFNECTGLTSITIGNNVTSIGNYVFNGCTSLKEVVFEDGTGTLSLGFNNLYNYGGKGLFYDCPLEKVYLGRNLSYNTTQVYGYSPFCNNATLTELTIGKNVSSIRNETFNGCTSLKEVVFEDGSGTLTLGYNSSGKGLFYDCPLERVYLGRDLSYNSDSSSGYSPFYTRTPEFTIGESVTSIPDNLFRGKLDMESYVIPENVTSIGNYAFYGCSNMSSLDLSHVTSIGNYAFYGCSNMSSIDLSHVTSIGNYAFYGCSNMSSPDLSHVTSIGNYAFYGFSNMSSPDLSHVTSIGDYAFSDCANIESISLPERMTSIGYGAFKNCVNLASIVIPEGVKSIGSNTFSNCVNLASIVIPEGVTIIGSSAFEGCSSISKIIIPSSVTSIGTGAFNGCTSLNEVVFQDGTGTLSLGFNADSGSDSKVGKGLFYDCPLEKVYVGRDLSYQSDQRHGYSPFYTHTPEFTIGGSVTSIGDYAFYGCSNMSSLDLSHVTSIGNYAFKNCVNLASIVIPEGVTEIGSSAFEGCSSISKIIIPSSVTSIANAAFNGCTSIKELVFEDGTNELTLGYGVYISGPAGKGMFYDCPLEKVYLGRSLAYPNGNFSGYSPFYEKSTLTELTIGDSVTSIGAYAFYGCSSINSAINLPNITKIGYYAFYNCISLTGLSLGSNLQTIGSYAFKNCSKIASEITIGDNVTSINSNAFYGCSSIPKVNIGAGVTTVGDYAFYNCSSLLDVDIKGTITSIGNNAWSGSYPLFKFRSLTPGVYGYNSNALVVPHEAVEAYRAAWPDYMNNIVDVALPTVYDIETSARDNESDIVKKVLAVAQLWDQNLTDAMLQVTELKVKGTINSYDIMVLHNKAINLKKLDLSEATIVANSYNYYQGLCSSNNTIGKYFLYNMRNLQEVILPYSATSMYVADYSYKSGVYSHEGIIKSCPALVKLTIGCPFVSAMAFVGCNIKEVKLDNGVTEIKPEAFRGCNSLTSVLLGENVSKIWKAAFYDCSALEEVSFGENVTEIGDNAFRNCRSLSNVQFSEEGEIAIGANAFNGCTSLTDVDLNEGVKSIGINAFEGCSGLQKVSICGAETINEATFSGCSALKEVFIGDVVKAIGKNAFYNNSALSDLTIGKNVSQIGEAAFYGCSGLHEIIIPEGVTDIAKQSFYGCAGLTAVHFSPGLETIGESAFEGCSKLEAAIMPTSLKSIGTNAFSGCAALTEVKIPSSITVIADGAFNATNIRDIYTWTIEPTNIKQNTFAGNLFTTALLHVPATANKLYYYDTKWSQFLRITNFFDPYEYFYLTNKDLIMDYETPRLQGLYDPETGIWKYSDADLGAGSALFVDGEDPQYLGNVRIVCDGANSTAIIGGNSSQTEGKANLNIDNLVIDMNIKKNRWYFYCFPFDLDFSQMEYDGQYVWRYYDGEKRAQNGNGGWTTVTDGHLTAMKGYIFQGSKDGVLTINVGKTALDGTDKGPEIYTYVSENARNASWNLVGNPNIGYFEVDDLEYEAPITVWDGNTYRAVRPGDEDEGYTMHPYQAFFVQAGHKLEKILFPHSHYETRNQSLDPNFRRNTAQRRARRFPANDNRKFINLELATDSVIDRTRVVFNNETLMGYETNCDAAKFMSDVVAQIYTLDNENNNYSINERPCGDYTVRLGFTAPAGGTFTLQASREDVEMEVYDAKTGKAELLSRGYTFTAGKGTDNDRFILRLPQDATSLDEQAAEMGDAEYIGIDGVNYGKNARRGVAIEKRGNSTRKVIKR